jgi:hypothetical protein
VTRLLFALVVPALAGATILPDTIGAYHRTRSASINVADKAVWLEYGLQEAEGATFEGDKDKFTVEAWRFNDTTGSMAAFQWQRPVAATVSKLAPMAVETPDSALLLLGNYLIQFNGRKPEPAEVAALTEGLKNVDGSPLPLLAGYLPAQGLVPNSERYILGPESLARFLPGVPASIAAFSFSAEAAAAAYGSGNNQTRMAVFNYPTHQIAMQREPEFRKIPGAVVKRSGPLVAVVLNPSDADLAEKLLGQVRYQATVTRDEYVPTKRDNIGHLVVNAFILIGILLAFAVISGLAFGGFRLFRGRGAKGQEADALVTLHLDRH